MHSVEVGQDTLFYRKSTLRIGDKILPLDPPVVMGILNVTPDSFSDGGKFNSENDWLGQVHKMISEGASIVDVGGYSTRPGAKEISPKEESGRVVPVIRSIKKAYPECLVSIDTFRSEVAENAVKAGACMVNDVSGGQLDSRMFRSVARMGVPYILMHMRGTPQTMKRETEYANILLTMWNYFRDRVYLARQEGIEEIILDPGFGFAKTIDQNYYILENLSYFHGLGLPLLAGLSRKSMIYKRLNIDASAAVNGTTVLNTVALQNGCHMLRVHDVKEAVEAIKLLGNIRESIP